MATTKLGLLPFIPDADNPRGLVTRLMDAFPPGSYLVISHVASGIQAETSAKVSSRFQERSAMAAQARTQADVGGFFDGLDLLAPGVVPINHWEPGSQPADQRETPLPAYAALGRK